jgi:flagellar hook-basal body complex protein FliE
MSILPIGGVLSAIQPAAVTQATSATAGADVAGSASTGAGSFGDILSKALDNVCGLQETANTNAIQAATGGGTNVHDVMISASEAQLATQLTVAVRDKAVTAFNSIMQMPV